MEFEIEIDLGDLGQRTALVSGLVDSDNNNVTLTSVTVVMGGITINILGTIEDIATEHIKNEYLELHEEEQKCINGQYLHDEHDYS